VSRRVLLRATARAATSVAVAAVASGPACAASVSPRSAYDVVVVKDGRAKSLSYLTGKVSLFVNVASYCAVRSRLPIVSRPGACSTVCRPVLTDRRSPSCFTPKRS
jgi:hypothetical protein